MADVWITAGVIAGVGLAGMTGHEWLDLAAAVFVALNLLRTGLALVSRSFRGLMDVAWPEEDIGRFQRTLASLASEGAAFSNLRTRRSGARRFAAVELRVPSGCSIERADAMAKAAEQAASREGVALLVRIRPAHSGRG